MSTRIQIRRDTSANWQTENTILAEGEWGYETDTNTIKIGDGTSQWSSLSYFSSGGTGTEGPQGDPGADGPQGDPGADGPQGDPGSGITFSGSVADYTNLPGDPTLGDAYIVLGDGHLYVWDGSSWIDSGEIVGPQGAPGSDGPQGDAGADGPQGDAGADGPQGDAGADGPQGDAGADGPQGDAGADGPQGDAGADGPQGDAGADGPQGDTGADGPQGDAGADGPQGDTGADGPQGDTGADGPQGDAGADGPQGDTGADGPQGDAGSGITFSGSVADYTDLPVSPTLGDAYVVLSNGHLYVWDGSFWVDSGEIVGPQGAPGSDGPQGDAGADGPQGDAGADGPQGDAGADGPQGDAGADGPQGDPGVTGGDGPQGAPGADGPQGDAGADGPQGDPGVTGGDGPQGDAGADSTVPGPTGETGPNIITTSTETNLTGYIKGDGTNVFVVDEQYAIEEDVKKYSGFENRTDSQIYMDGNDFNISPSTGYNVWIVGAGKQVITDTFSIEITEDQNITFVYLDMNVSTVRINKSTSPWEIKDGTAIPLAVVFKDGTTYAITDERHGYNRNLEWHSWAHNNIGAMYYNGLAGTFTATTTFSITQGIIYDEDIRFNTEETKTTTSLWYRNATDGMRLVRNSTTPYSYVGGNIQYDDGLGTLQSVGNNNYYVSWIYCSNDSSEPIYTVIGQGNHANINDARSESQPIINLSTAEWKLLYKVIYRNTPTPTYIESADFRNVQSGVPVTVVSPTSHTTLSNRDAENSHPSTAISTDTANFDGALSSLDDTVQKALETLDNNPGIAGPTGPQGDDGPQGDAGADGPQGDAGADGPQGDAGADGPQGDAGADGPQGDTGADGPQGDAGADGPQGDPGADGPQGDTGPQGEDGAGSDFDLWSGTQQQYNDLTAYDETTIYFIDGTVPEGPQGVPGADGPQGDLGADGTSGPQGNDGDPGIIVDETAPIGPSENDLWFDLTEVISGAQGPQGDAGADGPQGDPGADGPQGDPGADGPQGDPGADGPQGDAGSGITFSGSVADYTDLPGDPILGDAYVVLSNGHLYVWDGSSWTDSGEIVGPQGADGPQGDPGADGPQGDAGADGPQGDDGPQGEEGFSAITVSATEPASPSVNDLWFDTSVE